MSSRPRCILPFSFGGSGPEMGKRRPTMEVLVVPALRLQVVQTLEELTGDRWRQPSVRPVAHFPKMLDLLLIGGMPLPALGGPQSERRLHLLRPPTAVELRHEHG